MVLFQVSDTKKYNCENLYINQNIKTFKTDK